MDASLTMTLAISCLAFTGIWLINVMTEDAGVIDYYWGPGFAVIALVHIGYHGISGPYQWTMLAAVLIWSVRLAGHLIRRHHGATREDGRYRAMRESGGPNWWWASLFKVFVLQAILLWIIAAPMHVAFLPGGTDPVPAALFWTGMAVFALGFAIEWVADAQLANGKRAMSLAAPETGIFSRGLWGVSRHPNYVGEIILWWGLGVSAFAVSGSVIALAGPALLTAVIVGVSLPLTEQHMVRTRPGYAAYMERVPALLGVAGRARKRQNQPAE